MLVQSFCSQEIELLYLMFDRDNDYASKFCNRKNKNKICHRQEKKKKAVHSDKIILEDQVKNTSILKL